MLAGMEKRLFPDSWRRIDRAHTHGKNFREMWERWGHSEAHNVRIEMNDDWTAGEVKAIPKSLPDEDVALLLGEFFYQLRAALDSLIYQASIYAEGIDPPSNEGQVEFPICIDPGKFARNAVNRSPVPKDLRDWLEAIQPYMTRDESSPNHQLGYYLELLHDCARKDRHRKLHVAAAVPFEMGVSFSTTPGVTISDIEPVPCNLLDNETTVLQFRVGGVTRDNFAKIRLETQIGVKLGLIDIPIADDGNIGEELTKILNAVVWVTHFFEDAHGNGQFE